MSVLDAYLANYDQIAADHVAHWRDTGLNPFQDAGAVKQNEDMTWSLVGACTPVGATLLDAGCGMGDLLLRFPDRVCHGVDIAEPYLRVAHDERALNVQHAQVEHLPYPESMFDTVVACDILEHVLDLNTAVGELLRVLKPGGYVVTRVPNMAPVGWQPEANAGYDFVHVRVMDEGTVRILFGQIFGCEIIETRIVGDSLHCVARKPC